MLMNRNCKKEDSLPLKRAIKEGINSGIATEFNHVEHLVKLKQDCLRKETVYGSG